MRVSQIMTQIPTTVKPGQKLSVAIDELELSGIRHLPVVDDANRLVGLLTQRDLLRLPDSRDKRVRDVMRTDVKTVGPDVAAHEAAYLILRHRIGCVPITGDDGVVLGIVTDTDFVRCAYTLLGGQVPVDELEAEERAGEL